MAASLIAASIWGVRGWGSLSAPLRITLEALELTGPVGFCGLFDESQGDAERLALHFGSVTDGAAALVEPWVWAGDQPCVWDVGALAGLRTRRWRA